MYDFFNKISYNTCTFSGVFMIFLISFLNGKMKRKLYSRGTHEPSKAYEYFLLDDAFRDECEASIEMNEIHQDYAFGNIHSS